MVSPVRSERRMARTSAMGLRREPHPPMPRVMPLRSSPTTSSRVMTLLSTCLTTIHKRLAGAVGHSAEVELEGEALLETVAALDVHRLDPVERLLGPPDDERIL